MNLIKLFVFLCVAFGLRAATVLSVYGTGPVGQNRLWTLSESTNYQVGFYNNILGSNPEWRLIFYAMTPDHLGDWQVTFAARSYESVETDLRVGDFLGATRFGSVNSPALSITGNGRGESESTGWFRILELTWNPNRTPEKVAIDFYSRGDVTGYETHGSLRYNSNIPLASIPEPSSLFLTAIFTFGFIRRQR